jgi:cyanophycin synthetase
MGGIMEISKTKVLNAGNVYSRRPVMEMALAADQYLELSPDQILKFLGALPELRKEVSDFPGFARVATADAPVPSAALVEVVALLLQRYMNWPLRYCFWRPHRTSRKSLAVFEIATRRVGLRAGKIAVELVNTFFNQADADLGPLFEARIRELARQTGRETPSLDALLIARAAAKRGIIWSSLLGSHYLRLGMGQHAHILKGSETTTTSSIRRALVRSKSMTNRILLAAGLPAARQKTVRSREDALAAAHEIGFPVVVKPEDGNMGKGITVGVVDEAGLAAAFDRAQAESRNVLVEAFVSGDEYRLLVIDGRFVAAVCRRPASVRGDGVSTVRELVARENARPERELLLPGRMAALLPIVIDSAAVDVLAEQGHEEQSVPGNGEVVFLRRESNVSRGGDCVDWTERVHPSIRTVAERAARVLGIDVCGIDFISTDIGSPWRETGAVICEVNTRPGLCLHSHASEGEQRDVATEVVTMLFPKGAPSRIPVVALTDCAEGRELRTRIEAAAARAGRRLGVAVARGGDQPVLKESLRLETIADLQWSDSVELGVVEIDTQEVARGGLGLERIDLAILPAPTASRTMQRSSAALARAAGNRIATIDDPRCFEKALKALGLPTPRSATTPAFAEVEPGPRTQAGSDQFTALLLGDIGFGEFYMHHPRAGALQRLLSEHGHLHSFANLRNLLGSADMVIGNLEAPLSAAPDERLRGRKKYLCWSDGERAVTALKEAGIHALTLANNHALDGGPRGLEETLTRLRAASILSFGAGSDIESASQPLVARFRLGNVVRSLVVFGCFEHRRRYESRYRWYASQTHAGVNELSAEKIAATIKTLRTRLPRPIFIAFPHWGVDYTEVNEAQRKAARELVEAGVDLIIGHGAHTTQSVEMVNNRPVVYGIGNFVWNTPGRFAKLGAKPYGFAAAVHFRLIGTEPKAAVRLYPILTDNDRTGFQNRLLSEAEIETSTVELTGGWSVDPRSGRDEAGSYFEIDFPLQSAAASAAPTSSVAANGALPVLQPQELRVGSV